MTSHGLGTAEAIAAKDTNVPEWRLMIGSKPIPENHVYGSKESLGKSPQKDLEQNKLTYVSLLGLENAEKGT